MGTERSEGLVMDPTNRPLASLGGMFAVAFFLAMGKTRSGYVKLPADFPRNSFIRRMYATTFRRAPRNTSKVWA